MIPANTIKRAARYSLIRAGLEGVALSGAAGRHRASGAIFTLHHVDPQPMNRWMPNGGLSVTPEFLEQAILAAREAGLTPLALEDLPARLADKRDDRRYVCFTLDDGYRDNARHAAPVFRAHDIPYTIFITAGFVERTRSIWWETASAVVRTKSALAFDFPAGRRHLSMDTPLRRMSAFDALSDFVQQSDDEDAAIAALDAAARELGIDPLAITERQTMDAKELAELADDGLAHFGAHTLTHPNLRRVDEDRLRREIVESGRAVERYVGARPTSFAYPYGFAAAVGAREVAAVTEAGFDVAVTTMPGVIEPGANAPMTALKRISLNGFYQKKRYVKALLSGLPFKLRGRAGADLA